MFIGHFALGFAAKRAAPRVSLAWLFAAAQFADLLWPVLLAAGIESVRIDPGNTAFTPLDFVSYPYSHSLVLLAAWGVMFGALARIAGIGTRAAVLLCALVVSHWVLDVLTHRADMPLYPGSRVYGLGLWNSVPATLIIEFALYAAGLWLYTRTTTPRDRVGRWALVAFALFLVVVYLAAASAPPPSIAAIWMSGLAGGFLLIAWSGWIDRHRTART